MKLKMDLKKLCNVMCLLGLLISIVMPLNAMANTLAFFDFQDQVGAHEALPVSLDPAISSAVYSSNHPSGSTSSVEYWSSAIGGNGNALPYIQFTTLAPLVLEELTMFSGHNDTTSHNIDFSAMLSPTDYSMHTTSTNNSDDALLSLGFQELATFSQARGPNWTSLSLGSTLIGPGTYYLAFALQDESQIVTWTTQFRNDNVTLTGTPVPEPTTMLLLGSGIVGLAGVRGKFRKKIGINSFSC